jgi:hypothetical protein
MKQSINFTDLEFCVDIDSIPKQKNILFKYLDLDKNIKYGVGYKMQGVYVIGGNFSFDVSKKIIGWLEII